IGSARKLGNCEVLVKEALLQAKKEGAEVQALRLSDFHLLPCKGCLACVLKGEPCRLDDDMHSLWAHFQWADAIILSAPTYFLGPAGIIKLLIDRLFEYSLQIGQMTPRPGAIIATAGLQDWDPFTLPMLSMLAGILRLHPVDRFVAYRPGPGEVLLDEATVKRTQEIGTALVRQIHQPTQTPALAIPEYACPQCGTIFFQFREPNKVECQLCQAHGEITQKDNSIKIRWASNKGPHRWSPEAMAEHFSQWVLRTGPVYQQLRAEILQRIQKYRDFPIIEKPTEEKSSSHF
ncbi:MAG: flavodoxin family protein, partial [Promethearchaeota archaeon]